MANLTQRATGRLRDRSQTWIARGLQLLSQILGWFSPDAQTRIVRVAQVWVEIHVKRTADDATTQAAALTYASFLSLIPLIVLGLAVTAEITLTSGSDADWFREFVASIPGLEPLIGSQENELTRNAANLGAIGLVGVLWTASILSSRAQAALAVVFGLPRRVMVNRLRALAATLGLGLAFIVWVLTTGVVVGLHVAGLLTVPFELITSVVLLALAWGYFSLVYWALTPGRVLGYRDHLIGGAVMAIGWTALSYVGVILVDRTISKASALYGTLGTVFGLLLFLRMAMSLFLYGAEVTSVLRRTRLGQERADVSRPAPTPRGMAR
jgi:YihY family inner membrane protein